MIEDYLNLPTSFAALGISSSFGNYSVGSEEVEHAFELTSDIGINMLPQVLYILENQIDVLIYEGNLDLACNTAGAKRWTANFQWKGQAEFISKELKPWTSIVKGTWTKAGEFKEVNINMVPGDSKKTRFALVTIDGSGHMVCHSELVRIIADGYE
jgi:cathepsin A (carboxypeptidase C)